MSQLSDRYLIDESQSQEAKISRLRNFLYTGNDCDTEEQMVAELAKINLTLAEARELMQIINERDAK